MTAGYIANVIFKQWVTKQAWIPNICEERIAYHWGGLKTEEDGY